MLRQGMAYAVARKALVVNVENFACTPALFFDYTTRAETVPPRRTFLHNRHSSTPRRAAFLDLLQSPLPLSHLTTGEDRSYSILYGMAVLLGPPPRGIE